MAGWTMEEVLRMALRLEMENYGEYKKASERMENPAVRKMFAFLMSEEERHIRQIRDKMAEFKVTE
jgi:rubrerythrin